MDKEDRRKVTDHIAAFPKSIFMDYAINGDLPGYLSDDLIYGLHLSEWKKRLGIALSCGYSYVGETKFSAGHDDEDTWVILEMPLQLRGVLVNG